MDPGLRILDWTVDPFRNRLERVVRGARTEVHVEPKPMQVLAVLVERRGETVTREELFERVWEGRRVTDEVLTVTVSALRKALGDSARSPRYVQTVPGRGYRLIAPVDRPSRARAPGRFRALAAGLAALLLVVAHSRSTSGPTPPPPEAAARAGVPAAATDAEAELADRLAEARYLLRRREVDSARRARTLLETVVAEAPEHGDARVALAECHLLFAEIGPRSSASLGAARRAATAALALEESAAARAVLAQVGFALDWDFEGARSGFRAALAVDPRNARAHLGLGAALLALGRPEEALEHVEAYGRLDPHAYPSPFRAFVLTGLARLDEAARELERLATHAPDEPDLHLFLARVLAAAGDAEGCFRAYDAYYERAHAGADVRARVRERYEGAGLAGIHLFILERLEERRRSGGDVSPVELAAYHAFAGHVDQAFRWLERAYGERDLALPFIGYRPAFLALRDDPRMTALHERMRAG